MGKRPNPPPHTNRSTQSPLWLPSYSQLLTLSAIRLKSILEYASLSPLFQFLIDYRKRERKERVWERERCSEMISKKVSMTLWRIWTLEWTMQGPHVGCSTSETSSYRHMKRKNTFLTDICVAVIGSLNRAQISLFSHSFIPNWGLILTADVAYKKK